MEVHGKAKLCVLLVCQTVFVYHFTWRNIRPHFIIDHDKRPGNSEGVTVFFLATLRGHCILHIAVLGH